MRFTAQQDDFILSLQVNLIGNDLQITLTGGTPHIGAVALATPRPGLRDAAKRSADASVLTVSGHKEDLLARETALTVSAATGAAVCVVCGIHFDNFSPEQAECISSLARDLVRQCLAALTGAGSGG